MDEWQFDLAQRLEETARAEAEREAHVACAPQTHPNFDGVHCVEADCGDEIPAGRLSLGRVRCRECQERIERRRGGL